MSGKKVNTKLVIAGVAGAIGIFMFLLVLGTSTINSEEYQAEQAAIASEKENKKAEEEAKKKDEEIRLHLIVNTKEVVEEKLKSPGTAKYPFPQEFSIEEGVTDREGYKRYTISSYVDSENGFGAEVRSNFKVTLDYSLESTTYYVIECIIE